MRRILLALLLTAAAAAAPPPPPLSALEFSPEVYTLEECMRLALRNNAEVQTTEQGIAIARQRVREAQFLFMPDVGVQASATRYSARYPFALRPNFRSILLFPSDEDNVFSGQAYLSMPLYEGRRNVNTLQMSKAALLQAQSRFDAARLDILYGIKRVFYQYLRAQEEAAAADEAAARAEALAKALSGRWERLEGEALAAELRSARAEARHTLELSRLDFLKGLNKELDAPVKVKGRLETASADVDIQKALIWATELRPELKSQTYKAQMDALAVNLTLGRRYPTVALGLDYELTGQKFPLKQNNWDATVGIKLPFALDYWTQHTQKVAEQRQGEIARSELQDQVELEVRRAFQELEYWQAEWPRREEEHARMSALAEDAGRGAPASLEELRSVLRLFKSRRESLKAVTEHILARARLERAVGRPLSAE